MRVAVTFVAVALVCGVQVGAQMFKLGTPVTESRPPAQPPAQPPAPNTLGSPVTQSASSSAPKPPAPINLGASSQPPPPAAVGPLSNLPPPPPAQPSFPPPPPSSSSPLPASATPVSSPGVTLNTTKPAETQKNTTVNETGNTTHPNITEAPGPMVDFHKTIFSNQAYFAPSASGIFQLNSDNTAATHPQPVQQQAAQAVPSSTFIGIGLSAAIIVAIAGAIVYKVRDHMHKRKQGQDQLWGAAERGIVTGEEEQRLLENSRVLKPNGPTPAPTMRPLAASMAAVLPAVPLTPLDTPVRYTPFKNGNHSETSSLSDFAKPSTIKSIGGGSSIASLPLLLGTGLGKSGSHANDDDEEEEDMTQAVLGAMSEASVSRASLSKRTSTQPHIMASSNLSKTSLTSSSNVKSSASSQQKRRKRVKKPKSSKVVGGGNGQGVPLLEGMNAEDGDDVNVLLRTNRNVNKRLSSIISSDDNIVS